MTRNLDRLGIQNPKCRTCFYTDAHGRRLDRAVAVYGGLTYVGIRLVFGLPKL